MAVFDLFRSKPAASLVANKPEVVRRYKRLRSVALRLNNTLMRQLSRQSLETGAKRLGMWEGKNTIAFQTEDESSVLMDYCIYNVRRKGRNAIEQFLLDSPPPDDSDEMTLLRSMQHAFYSVFLVEKVERGLGVLARDMASGNTLVIVDLGFGQSARTGMMLAGRLLPMESYYMTSGAALPLGEMPARFRDEYSEILRGILPVDDGTFDPAPLIRMILDEGLSAGIRYQALPGANDAPLQSPRRGAKIGRNEPCPCGSGKKYKHCCSHGK